MLDKFVLDPFCSVKETPAYICIRLPLDYVACARMVITRIYAVPW